MNARALLVASLVLAPTLARADDTFEAKAAGAKKLAHVDDVVWALTAACTTGDDTQQRQCRTLRDRSAQALAGATLLVDADPDSLDLGAWSAAKKSVSVTLSACIRCGGIASEGKTWRVTGGAPKVENGKVRGPALYDTARQFASGDMAAAWQKAVEHRKVELLVKLSDKPRWNVGGIDGLALDVLGYRVITPCNGTVVLANPPSGNAPPDKAACAAGGAAVVALTPELVSEAMEPAMAVIKTCAGREKAAGKAKLELTISDDGTLAGYEQTGAFVGTPMGKCIDAAVKKITFPRSAKPRTKIGFPIVVP